MMNEKWMRHEMSNVELEMVSGGQMAELDLKKCNDFIAALTPAEQDKANELLEYLLEHNPDADYENFCANWDIYKWAKKLV